MSQSLPPSRLARLRAAIAAAVGIDELLLAAGLVLITVALWPVVNVSALLAPGVVMVWIALPTRAPFVPRATPPADAPARRRS